MYVLYQLGCPTHGVSWRSCRSVCLKSPTFRTNNWFSFIQSKPFSSQNWWVFPSPASFNMFWATWSFPKCSRICSHMDINMVLVDMLANILKDTSSVLQLRASVAWFVCPTLCLKWKSNSALNTFQQLCFEANFDWVKKWITIELCLHHKLWP